MQICESGRESRQPRWLHLELERIRIVRLPFIVTPLHYYDWHITQSDSRPLFMVSQFLLGQTVYC